MQNILRFDKELCSVFHSALSIRDEYTYKCIQYALEVIIDIDNIPISEVNGLMSLSMYKRTGRISVVLNNRKVYDIFIYDFLVWYKRNYESLSDTQDDAFISLFKEFEKLDSFELSQLITKIVYSGLVEYRAAERAVLLMCLVKNSLLQNYENTVVCKYNHFGECYIYIENSNFVYKLESLVFKVIPKKVYYDDLSHILVIKYESGSTTIFKDNDVLYNDIRVDAKVVENTKRFLLLSKFDYEAEFEV